MPTLKELVVKFKADLEDMERGYDAADKGAEDYAKKQEQAHQEASTSAVNAGARIQDALVKPMENAAAAAARWVSSNPAIAARAGIVLAIGAVAYAINKQTSEVQVAVLKADEFSLALRKQAAEMRSTAVAAGEYGRELAAALRIEQDRRAGAETDRLLQLPPEAVEERLRSLKAQYDTQVKKEAALRVALAVRAPFAGGVKARGEEARKEAEERALSLASQIGALENLPLLRAKRAGDQAKEIAANEAANKDAMRAAYVIAAGDIAERQKRAAWVHRTQALEGVQAAQDEYHKKWKSNLNVAAQVQAIEARYKDTVQAIDRHQAEQAKAAADHAATQAASQAAKEAQAARDSQIKTAAARIYIQAEQTADEYDKQRLEIKAKHLETLGQLAKAGASEVEYQLATLRSQNALKAVGEEERKAREDTLRKSQERAALEREAASRQQAEERSAGISRMAMAANAAGNTAAGAQWRAYDTYQSKLSELNRLKEEGIDVTKRLALAEDEYRTAYMKPVQDQLAAYTKEIEANARAQKDAAMSQVGFTGLRGMWQRAMEAGARERFYEPPTAENERGREQTRLPQQTRLLEGILAQLSAQSTKWDRLLAEYRS